MELVLSLFPGIDLMGRGFEQAGYSVVRGPDLIYAQDVRHYRTVPGRFDGVIGGPPCPDFSKLRRGAPSGYGVKMIEEFLRLVAEASPMWWVMENVPGVPDVTLTGYSVQRLDLDAKHFGLPQRRLRHFQVGLRDAALLVVPRSVTTDDLQACCVASEGGVTDRRDWASFCALQGVEPLCLPGMSIEAKYRAVGNAVPVPVAFALACAIRDRGNIQGVQCCACGCARQVVGRQLTATAACRKRMQRRRDSLVDRNPGPVTL